MYVVQHDVTGMRRLRSLVLPVGAVVFIGIGLVAGRAWGWQVATQVWFAGLVLTGAPVAWTTLRGMFAGRFAADVVALLAIVGSALLVQPFVGLVIVLMQTGGELLEVYAEGRASRAVRELEEMAPRTAHLVTGAGVRDVRAEDVNIGDTLLVRPGELVPCDSIVLEGRSHVDASRLTGEAVPISAVAGTRLMSGSLNGDGALTLRALAISRESQYARIVELVRSAQASKAPLQRVADKYAVWFTPATIAVCVLAYAATRDASRVLAVLAVATPCPLILATPVAILGGINISARRHIIIRHGTALERIGQTTVAIFDKTGTITIGRPMVSRVESVAPGGEGEVLRLASGVEQGSSHLLARTLVECALAQGLTPPAARNVVESAGRGVEGDVDGRRVLVGALSFARERYPGVSEWRGDGAILGNNATQRVRLMAYVVVDSQLAGVVEYADAMRPGVKEFFAKLASLGIRRIVLLSGDHAANAGAVANELGITEFEGDLLPQDKVARVQRLTKEGENVLMVGDGTNDAPALSAATVGVALAGHGGGITAEAADIVLLKDDLTSVAESIEISRRTMRIARQGIRFGLGLSVVGMMAASLGYLAPVAGALVQEAIDLSVIVNAARKREGSHANARRVSRECAKGAKARTC
jgi:heavy metal translocating P-type ATPase